jgi:cysteinyl-tRNA synthetase
VLQAQYRSTLDFSDAALSASSKGYKRWIQGLRALMSYEPAVFEATPGPNTAGPGGLLDPDVLDAKARAALNDDLNSPVLIATLYELLADFQELRNGKTQITPEAWNRLRQTVQTYVEDVLGFPLTTLTSEEDSGTLQALDAAMEVLMSLRQEAKASKDWALSDRIRDHLTHAGFKIMDDKEGSRWSR